VQLEDCFSFLRELHPKSQFKIFHVSLDLTVEPLLRSIALLGLRNTHGHVGHVHYFTKDSALATLEELGFNLINDLAVRIMGDTAYSCWLAELIIFLQRQSTYSALEMLGLRS